MITALIFFTPALLLAIWNIYIGVRKHDWASVICIPLFTLITTYQFVILAYKWEDEHLVDSLVKINYWVSDLLMVIIYIYICTRTGRKWVRSSTAVLFALIFLNLSSGVALYLGEPVGAPPPTDDRLHIISDGVDIFKMRLWQFCMATQFIWILARLNLYQKRIKKEHLHFSKNTKQLAWAVVVTQSAGFCSLFIPPAIWYGSKIPLLTILTIVSIGLAVCLAMVAKGYALTPVLDMNNEPAAYASYETRESIWDRIQKAVDTGRLFLNPNITLEDVAKEVGTNRTYITNAIAQNTETNFNGYINHLRIAHATTLMGVYPEKKLEEIAELCGFSSASAFTKIFKKETGQTPKECKRVELKKMKVEN